MKRKPNILFVMADQLAPAFLPAYGHRLVKTPHLDALAGQSTVFDAAYCNYPICAPSRFSMLSGRLSSKIGAYDNGAEFPSAVPTVMHYLRATGYHTALAGKMHFVGADQRHGYEDRLNTDIYPSDFGWTADWKMGTAEVPESPTGINPRSVIESGLCARSMQIDYDDDTANVAVQKIYDLARAPEQQPFFLTVSFTHPHNPFVTTSEYWDRYRHEDIDMPRVPSIPWEKQDGHSRRLHYLFRLDEYRVSETHLRNARHAYYGMISYLDDKVGMLLQALRAAGLSDDTIVVFTADHGEMMGERGLWFKQSFFENSVRVPMMVRLPGRGSNARRCALNVSLVDLLPTLLDLATDGNPPELVEEIEGRSFAPMVHGTTSTWPDTVAAEFTAEGAITPCVMLKRGTWKYIASRVDAPQLYDLASDPLELANRAGDKSVTAMEKAFRDDVAARWNLDAYHEAVLAGQRTRLFLQKVLMSGQPHPWDFQPWRDASKQYVRGGAKTTMVKGKARLPFVEPVRPENPRRKIES
jgi:choline-sulfatase